MSSVVCFRLEVIVVWSVCVCGLVLLMALSSCFSCVAFGFVCWFCVLLLSLLPCLAVVRCFRLLRLRWFHVLLMWVDYVRCFCVLARCVGFVRRCRLLRPSAVCTSMPFVLSLCVGAACRLLCVLFLGEEGSICCLCCLCVFFVN